MLLLLLDPHHPLSNATEYLCDRGAAYMLLCILPFPSLALSCTSLLFFAGTTDSES
jgi:hypothetical protein